MLSSGPGFCLGLGVWLQDCPPVSHATAKLPRIKEIGGTVTEDGHLWLRSFEKLPPQDRCKEKVPRKKNDVLIL